MIHSFLKLIAIVGISKKSQQKRGESIMVSHISV